MTEPILEIQIAETAGILRDREPVTQGIPFPKGVLPESSGLLAMDDKDNSVPIAATPLARWSDGSIKWMLLDLQLSMPAKSKKCVRLHLASEKQGTRQENALSLKLSEGEDNISVQSGEVTFELDVRTLRPFRQINMAGHPLLREDVSRIALIDEYERTWLPRVDRHTIEHRSPLRLVLAFEGTFVSGFDVHALCYQCRIHFLAGKSTARIDFTLWNPRAAQHPGGVWDLGDKGSVFFRDLSVELALPKTKSSLAYYALEVGGSVKTSDENLLIYQDSSGGENWRSHTHINRDEKIPISFQGFELRTEQQPVSNGRRATPFLAASHAENALGVCVKHFWQNFPKALAFQNDKLSIGLFPRYFDDLFELQGGERKTHTLYVCGQEPPLERSCFDWVHQPLQLDISPEWYYASGACYPKPSAGAASDLYFSEYQHIIDSAAQGENSFFARREIIDEYGWRNFGDIYADHEAVVHEGEGEFVSHYNNQFDVIKGAIIQFMRSGSHSWFQMADELAKHVVDIDIYHTDQDRYEYRNGLFWHTDHHLDAATSTHRSASYKHRDLKAPHLVGSGPAPSHNYATGLLYYYWLTGNVRYKEGALALADNIMNNLEGSDILLERCVTAGKKLAKQCLKYIKRSDDEYAIVYGFNGPGRGSGNALNTLLDAFLLDSDDKYMGAAEKLIGRCVSPADNIDDRDLLNAEFRWMYTIFLQSLGKYLDIKHDIGQLDRMFWYARTVLLTYAAWMCEHEYPYLEKPEILEFPNESWSAQEIRKSDVFAHAAQYAPKPLRQRLLERSRFFFETCITQLRDDFPESKYLTRVIAVLMSNGMVHLDTFSQFRCVEEIASKEIDYSVMPDVQTNGIGAQLKQHITVIKQTSLRKEFQWLKRFWVNR